MKLTHKAAHTGVGLGRQICGTIGYLHSIGICQALDGWDHSFSSPGLSADHISSSGFESSVGIADAHHTVTRSDLFEDTIVLLIQSSTKLFCFMFNQRPEPLRISLQVAELFDQPVSI